MTTEETNALRIARVMIDTGMPEDQVLSNPAIPEALRQFVTEQLASERVRYLRSAPMISADLNRGEWLNTAERSNWYYWTTLRSHLLMTDWTSAAVSGLDEETDRILPQLGNPTEPEFDIRGLVLGYVQSGKTANFTALIAKAVDVGYRLVIVLSGLDKGLRRQTQIRLKRELVGYPDNRSGAVPFPPMGKHWHEFTSEDLEGDFDPGRASAAALQGSQPVLLVVKKNGPVLRKILRWLGTAPTSVHQELPLLLIDDEADNASVDTRGDRLSQPPGADDEYEDPTTINKLIRQVLNQFSRKSYVAYTATPFANILIPHDNVAHPDYGADLYPKDFFIALQKRPGYFGVEEFFGRFDSATESEKAGLDVVRMIPDQDIPALDAGQFPSSLADAMMNFVLAGAARRQRGAGEKAATMLIHTSHLRDDHRILAEQVRNYLRELRNEWRYQRSHILPQFKRRWEAEFQPVTRAINGAEDTPFESLIEHVTAFLNVLDPDTRVREVNSERGDVLDYVADPTLKAIAVGGNKLARGLTLEGLLTSYFARTTNMYDTLMQMGRWFGYRSGYADLTRIHTTPELSSWFHDLAAVEHQLREDIAIYERQRLTPLELGMRIRSHPAMLVTSRAKQRHSTAVTISQTYAAEVVQTVRFPFNRPQDLRSLSEDNLALVREFLHEAGKPSKWAAEGPLWSDSRRVSCDALIDFIRRFRVDGMARSISTTLLAAYIERQLERSELTHWTVSIQGRQRLENTLGVVDWGLGKPINQISRTRLKSDLYSIGVVTEPREELLGLTLEQITQAEEAARASSIGINVAARSMRPSSDGLLLLYPISKHSGYNLTSAEGNRRPLFDEPNSAAACDLIGLALSFPSSQHPPIVDGEYVTGTVAWRAAE
ncbi:MAG: Z1 domain-containing protein [Flavobacteriales bacterium]|nr:Z1 domain-containing protein [Flavobacteriales bacterium]